MLIDINAHVGHWPFQELRYGTCSGLLERMNRFGVDISVVSNISGVCYKNTQPANEALHRDLRSNSAFTDRFIPFAVINPAYAGWRDDLKVCREKLGMRGIRLYPKYHDYELTSDSCVELLKMARDMSMPVAFTLRMVDHRQRSWMDIQQEWSLKDVTGILRAVPDGRYMILNIANGATLGPEDTDVLRKTDVLMDTSGRALVNLPDLLKKYGTDKFAFGTHAPIHDYLTGLLRIESMTTPEADEKTKQQLRGANAKRFLKI